MRCDLAVQSSCSAVLVDCPAEELPDRRVEWNDDRRVMLGWVLGQVERGRIDHSLVGVDGDDLAEADFVERTATARRVAR